MGNKYVYVVIRCDYDDTSIIAVYANAKKAEKRAEEENKKENIKRVHVEEWRLEK